MMASVIPARWTRKLSHLYVPELLVGILGAGSAAFGITVITMPGRYREIPSFAQAFAIVPPHWWGLVMMIVSVAMLSLLAHSRAAAAVPTFMLAGAWISWVVPIVLSPGFAPSAPIVYGMISLINLVVGLACLVPREGKS